MSTSPCQPKTRPVSSETMLRVDELLHLDNPDATPLYPVVIVIWRGPCPTHPIPEHREKTMISPDHCPAYTPPGLLRKAEELARLQMWGTVSCHHTIMQAHLQPWFCQNLADCLGQPSTASG